jgi:hypothetical protein
LILNTKKGKEEKHLENYWRYWAFSHAWVLFFSRPQPLCIVPRFSANTRVTHHQLHLGARFWDLAARFCTAVTDASATTAPRDTIWLMMARFDTMKEDINTTFDQKIGLRSLGREIRSQPNWERFSDVSPLENAIKRVSHRRFMYSLHNLIVMFISIMSS